MIKRLIFDVDNTLVAWTKEYALYSEGKALDELGIKHDDELLLEIDRVNDDYEKYYDTYDKLGMAHFLNERLNLNLPDNFVDVWMKYLCDCYPEPSEELIDTLEYLSSKYDLVILSNFFEYSQEKRLENMGIDKYFSKRIYTEKIKNKPNKEAFMEAVKPYNIDECIMIGDNPINDIKGAQDIGMKTILINNETKVEDLRRIL